MRKYAIAAVITATLTAITQTSTAQGARRDGNWWRELSPVVRTGVAVGFFDGLRLGRDFAYWGIPNIGDRVDPCMFKATDSYDKYSEQYVSPITAGQLVDGLNSFYEDYRNRSIMSDRAIWLVLNGIAGTPEGRLQTMIEAHRRSAPR
jgi:hypothetical protein